MFRGCSPRIARGYTNSLRNFLLKNASPKAIEFKKTTPLHGRPPKKVINLFFSLRSLMKNWLREVQEKNIWNTFDRKEKNG